MSKVRVYELARELNLDSKELVEKLKMGGMNIKNYMSTLDKEAIDKAHDIVAGKVSEVIVEKRIKPTVIRRRKKTVTIEPEKPAVGPEEVVEEVRVEPEQVVVAPETQLEAAEAVPAGDKKAVHEEEAKEEVVEEAEPEERAIKGKPRGTVKKARRRKLDQPAKIIKRPEEGPLKTVIEEEKAKEREVEEVPPVLPGVEQPEVEAVPEGERFQKKKKKKGEGKEEIPRGLIRHRKVEVFERADLYEGRMPKRKEMKTAKKSKEVVQKAKQTEITTPKPIKRKIRVPEQVTVAELAKAMGVKASELIKKLMEFGVVATINQLIDFETASVVADSFSHELELDLFQLESIIAEGEDKPEDLKPRPPVVTIMGHVDHGKTSLLDYIRQSNIIGGESGGITQHIGAYYVKTKGGDIVFLDTPGHEAFTAMRARGAKVTDIIVLVVAADDGVMPQTVEAINHARAAEIPIIVAVNKIDKPEANLEKVRRQLADLGLVPEEWGGESIFANISAKTGEGVEEFLELLSLQSEFLELKANPNKSSRGTIIEARLDKTKGPVATVLIKRGTLRQGDFFVCGEHYGKVRAMLNHRGKRMISAGPSFPVEIYGISGVPMAGDEFIAVKDERTAKQVMEYRHGQVKTKDMPRRGIVSLDDLFQRVREGEVKELNIILKADVQGSIEALSESLLKLSTEDVKLKIIHSSTGSVTETDVMLASASGAIILGFNVRANPRVTEVAEKERVDIRYYDVIYNVLKDIRLAMTGLLEPVYKEIVIGRMEVKEIFHVPKLGTVAGCQVNDGYIERNANIRLLRDDVVIYDGKVASLRRFKDDVKEVQAGYECGVGLENFQDLKPGDVLEAYRMEKVEVEL